MSPKTEQNSIKNIPKNFFFLQCYEVYVAISSVGNQRKEYLLQINVSQNFIQNSTENIPAKFTFNVIWYMLLELVLVTRVNIGR